MGIARDTLTRSLNSISIPVEQELSGVDGGSGSGYETVNWSDYGTVFLNMESVSDEITLGTGNEVDTWNSRLDGNSRTLVFPQEGFSREAPDFNSSGFFNNGVGSIDFDSSNLEALQYGQASTDWAFMTAGNDSTLFLVVNATFSAADTVILCGTHNGNSVSAAFGFRIFKDTGQNRIRTWCGDGVTRYDFNTGSNTFVSGTSYIIAVRVEEGATNEVEIFINGASAATSALNNSAAGFNNQQFTLGADNNIDENTLNGSVGQLLVYSTALSSANMTEVFTKLSSNWGIDVA